MNWLPAGNNIWHKLWFGGDWNWNEWYQRELSLSLIPFQWSIVT
jgi:hypothetical protein